MPQLSPTHFQGFWTYNLSPKDKTSDFHINFFVEAKIIDIFPFIDNEHFFQVVPKADTM